MNDSLLVFSCPPPLNWVQGLTFVGFSVYGMLCFLRLLFRTTQRLLVLISELER